MVHHRSPLWTHHVELISTLPEDSPCTSVRCTPFCRRPKAKALREAQVSPNSCGGDVTQGPTFSRPWQKFFSRILWCTHTYIFPTAGPVLGFNLWGWGWLAGTCSLQNPEWNRGTLETCNLGTLDQGLASFQGFRAPETQKFQSSMVPRFQGSRVPAFQEPWNFGTSGTLQPWNAGAVEPWKIFKGFLLFWNRIGSPWCSLVMSRNRAAAAFGTRCGGSGSVKC